MELDMVDFVDFFSIYYYFQACIAEKVTKEEMLCLRIIFAMTV